MASPVALKGNQKLASEPRENVWLSASAGTGKTQVLSARVMRLLLSGADPSSILCLTFTKAGATEMADRINARLASWVRMKGPELFAELEALGEYATPELMATARKLFARVLDASGTGLRIQTIHSFCQTLLSGFPVEAGLIPGFRPMEGREEAVLARQVMADMLVSAEARGDTGITDALRAMSLRLGEGGAESFLANCARAPDAMETLGEDIGQTVRTALDVPDGDVEAAIAAACGDFDDELDFLAEANAGWAAKSGQGRSAIIREWLALDLADRAARLGELHLVWAKADGDPRSFKAGQAPQVDGYEDAAMALHGQCAELLGLRARAGLAILLAQGLGAGRTYARAYAEAKRAAGVVDFDDLIRSAVSLLGQSHMAEWIRFKLDQATDHILVDEAQDTNAQQWAIIRALAEEFFVAEPEDGRPRTIFSVGDFKQAIFGFQGTDPRFFGAAQLHFERQARAADRDLLGLSLTESFRSTEPVLTLVDAVLTGLGEGALSGLIDLEPHRSAVAGPGRVTLWAPVSPETAGDGDIDGEESWLSDSTRRFATLLARQIKSWLDAGLWINNRGRPKPLEPQDILILVRRRSELASLIVARLHAEGVAVAGVDRLRLNAPLAVRDLLAAVRFAIQPQDDLNLAALLVSPLVGWSQDDLYRAAHGRGGTLWAHLGDRQPAALREMLRRADFTTPYRFLEEILSGPLDGRRKLLRRLGQEARDPIEELLNAALQFERDATPTMQAFLDRFERETEDIKRDPSQPLDAVRVMTAHGAKGLQAPLVILADATVDPGSSPRGKLDWPVVEGGADVPIFRPRKDELTGSLADAAALADAREMEEHWRLLYVALTRAEEWLVVGGALGPRAKGVAPEKSWHAAVERAMVSLEAEPVDEAPWGLVRHYAGGDPVSGRERMKTGRAQPPLPAWLGEPAPIEARPPRPLAPSSLGDDDAASPPPEIGMRAAAERGRHLHALFERLPEVPAADRERAALAWLEKSAGVADDEERLAILSAALAVIDGHPALFVPGALAEAPIAAVVGGDVIAGTVDRLIVEEHVVRLVDFKTGRRVPGTAEAAPVHHLRQMSAYAEALKVIFPGRRIEAALLYTAGPTLIPLDSTLLALHKPGLQGTEQSLGQSR
jgi:ATP-dependent helicase/nuclease subunit A